MIIEDFKSFSLKNRQRKRSNKNTDSNSTSKSKPLNNNFRRKNSQQ